MVGASKRQKVNNRGWSRFAAEPTENAETSRPRKGANPSRNHDVWNKIDCQVIISLSNYTVNLSLLIFFILIVGKTLTHNMFAPFRDVVLFCFSMGGVASLLIHGYSPFAASRLPSLSFTPCEKRGGLKCVDSQGKKYLGRFPSHSTCTKARSHEGEQAEGSWLLRCSP